MSPFACDTRASDALMQVSMANGKAKRCGRPTLRRSSCARSAAMPEAVRTSRPAPRRPDGCRRTGDNHVRTDGTRGRSRSLMVAPPSGDRSVDRSDKSARLELSLSGGVCLANAGSRLHAPVYTKLNTAPGGRFHAHMQIPAGGRDGVCKTAGDPSMLCTSSCSTMGCAEVGGCGLPLVRYGQGNRARAARRLCSVRSLGSH